MAGAHGPGGMLAPVTSTETGDIAADSLQMKRPVIVDAFVIVVRSSSGGRELNVGEFLKIFPAA
jgi:hypothetical protein